MTETIAAIRAGWPEYRKTIKTAKGHEIYQQVVTTFPALLERSLGPGSGLTFTGSTGRGNITAAPWIATFDPTVTGSATGGFYVVYLFSVDLKRLYVSIAFGTTQFAYFPQVERHRKLREAARHLQTLLQFPRPLYLDAIDLAASAGDGRHIDYQQSNIAAIEYDLDDLPSEETLVRDYLYLIELYRHLARHPLRPDLQQLFEAAIDAPPSIDPDVATFTPRPPRQKRTARGGGGGERYSQASKKVGDRGEQIVFDYERARAIRAGYKPEQVKWLSKNGETPGWDITSVDDFGLPIHIEVKASVGPGVSGLLLTANEWIAAVKHGARYHIYLVTDAMKSKSKIEIIRDPVKLIESGALTISEAVWALSLHPNESSSVEEKPEEDDEGIATMAP
ncbi:DUF3578 domain-containing protein [Rhizobium sp. P32RR-XVIII]|uniref:MrcB family domain-containing protein n=1 Tax=Rhizobium sp. P32RR-XVIII TaxID=2726738 RepID=UPI0014569031|nr:DUF3578 domain-containing protein [Rhizobium sp. P32RR-XVIII]NLS01996.1 DUF3578 domain-containing protein [Rhizobium sp. P32RR-XVIII]